MDFYSKRPYGGNEKPLAQHVQGDTLTEWRVSDDRNRIVQERKVLSVMVKGPRGGTFFLGGMETTRDELADYIAEANERNEKTKRPDRLPEVQRKIERLRERHAEAIRAAVGWKQAGYRLPKRTLQQQRELLLPKAMAVEGPGGKLRIIGVRHGKGN
jgi:hypothetical protein